MEKVDAHPDAEVPEGAAASMASHLESTALAQAGVSIRLDYASGNFIPDMQGTPHYIDFVLSDVSNFDIDETKALRYFDIMNGWKFDKKHIGAERKQLMSSIQRLKELRVIYYAYWKGCDLTTSEAEKRFEELNEESKRRVEKTVDLLKPIYEEQFGEDKKRAPRGN